MKKTKGSILILSMFVLAVTLLLAGSFLQLALSNIMGITTIFERTKAEWIARAGIAQQIHDLRAYWYLNQEKVTNTVDFGGGTYKVGTATLIGRGFHKALVVSVGRFGDGKKCEIAEVSMNTPVDYGTYVECSNYQLPIIGIFYGPFHINGDATMGLRSLDTICMKDENDYGPAISVGRRFYVNHTSTTPSTTRCGSFGEGVFNPMLSSKSMEYFIYKNGAAEWTNGPYDEEKYPTLVEKTAPDGTAYSYRLLEDKDSGSTYFKNIPKTSEISYEKYRHLVPEDWYITEADPKKLKVVLRTNECLMGKDNANYTGSRLPRYDPAALETRVNFDSTGFTYYVTDKRDLKYLRFLYLQYKGDSETPLLYAMGLGDMEGFHCYSIDRMASKIIVKYRFIWDGYRFPFAPGIRGGGAWGGLTYPIGGGQIRGWKRTTEIGSSGGSGAVVTTDKFPIMDEAQTFGYEASTKIDCRVQEGNAAWNTSSSVYSLWTPVASLSTAGPSDRVFEINYDTGTLTFGNGVNGMVLPNPSALRISYTYKKDFDSNQFFASVDATVKCAELDLNTITEENCPRDPKDPLNPDKYGVIFSEMPLIIWGVPKVPVTIICTEDVYVGPINTDHQDPLKIEDVVNYKKYGLVFDDPKAFPVGIMTKKILWYDKTLGIWEKYDGNPPAVLLNTFTNYWKLTKQYTLNKVALFSPFIYKYGTGPGYYWQRTFGVVETGNGGSDMDIDYTRTSWRGGFGYYAYNEYPIEEATRKIYGSVYKDGESGGVDSVESQQAFLKFQENLPYGFSTKQQYTSSFRTNPPPHVPMYVYVSNMSSISDFEKGEKFIASLDELIKIHGAEQAQVQYTADFTNALTDMLNEIDGIKK